VARPSALILSLLELGVLTQKGKLFKGLDKLDPGALKRQAIYWIKLGIFEANGLKIINLSFIWF